MSKQNKYTDSSPTENIVTKKQAPIKKAEKIFTPTQNRIFSMPLEILIKHNALIEMKVSSMSAEERRLVKNRIFYNLKKGNITAKQLDNALLELAPFFPNQII